MALSFVFLNVLGLFYTDEAEARSSMLSHLVKKFGVNRRTHIFMLTELHYLINNCTQKAISTLKFHVETKRTHLSLFFSGKHLTCVVKKHENVTSTHIFMFQLWRRSFDNALSVENVGYIYQSLKCCQSRYVTEETYWCEQMSQSRVI